MIYRTPHSLINLGFKNYLYKMEASKTFSSFPHLMIYAFLEWIMIILLFVDGFLAFFCNEFAKFFGLQIPCLLCTRIDHVLVHRDPSFYYNDSICEAHKKDMSSLAYCHAHRKLSDIRTMCQGCLVSFASDKDLGCDKYKSIVGVLHKDIDRLVEKKEAPDEKSGINPWCSCCGEPVKLKSSMKYIRGLSTKPTVSSPRVSWMVNRNEDGRLMETPRTRFAELKFAADEGRLMETPRTRFAELKFAEDEGRLMETPRSRFAELKLAADEGRLMETPRTRFAELKFAAEDGRLMETPRTRFVELKFAADNESEFAQYDSMNADNQRREVFKGATTLLQEPEEISEFSSRTPSFLRGNKYFGIPLDSAQDNSPRWLNRGIRKPLPEKGNAFVEPNDSEVDVDILNHLKKQVRLDHKSLMVMYMELDKERSAAAVAANNAMAMISKVQAEKAAVQMEALQYQRMMEEQVEYDEEAMQMMSEMIAKRDEDVKALESELEIYREKYGAIARVGSDICEVDAEEDFPEIRSERSDIDSLIGAEERESEHSFDVEGERAYLLGHLTVLEKKLLDMGAGSDFLGTIKNEDECRGNENKAVLTREVSMIKDRLRVVEADSGFLKHAAMTLQIRGEGTKLLSEIAEHLRVLRRAVGSPSDDIDA